MERAECEIQSKKITIEIKSLNSKQLDLNLRLPTKYKEKELEIRNDINKELIRGKVDLSISMDSSSEESSSVINVQVIKNYVSQLRTLAEELNIPMTKENLIDFLRLPDVFKMDKQELSNEEWKQLQLAIFQAIQTLIQFRQQEGFALAKDMKERVDLIMSQIAVLETYESQRMDRLKVRLKQNLAEAVGIEKIDDNRFEQELIFYLEKMDITEEKVRLANHCQYFLETMSDQESNGKKLGFIAQEIGREINTIGSKANHAEMQKIVIGMKDELEKIKEQVNNIL